MEIPKCELYLNNLTNLNRSKERSYSSFIGVSTGRGRKDKTMTHIEKIARFIDENGSFSHVARYSWGGKV